MDKFYTFTTLFKEPIPIGNGESRGVSQILIPRIQRPYAQGRSDEESRKVRERFLTDIFSVLRGYSSGLDLTFVYGKVSDRDGVWTMELLDGQQRLTTLFLLYWYFLQRGAIPTENEGAVSKAIGSFAYETRDSSKSFCRLLAKEGRQLTIGGNSGMPPSKVIRDLLDYSGAHEKDPTVSAMLVMLDDIHGKYSEAFPEGTNGELWPRIEHIRFRVLSLTEYKLSEELYIKMNARGLKLTPFECFKADFLELMDGDERSGRKVDLETGKDTADASDAVTFKQRFGIRLDTHWCDLFWNPSHPELYDQSYMLFFARFFAARFLLEHQADIHGKQWQTDKNLDLLVFHHDHEKDPKHYHGIRAFREMVDSFGRGVRYFDDIAHFLDVLFDRKKEILAAMKPLWESEEWIQPDWFCDGSTPFEQMSLVKVSAVFEFSRLFPDFPVDMFRVWMKIVNCVVENTNIDNYTPTANTAGNLASLLRKIAEKAPATVMDFVKAMADVDARNLATAIREEIAKARRISGSTNESEAKRWVEAFDEVSRHPFLKGMIGFFHSPDIGIDAFEAHVSLIGSLFDENGIAPSYRDENHWMLRAVFSQPTTFNHFNGRYLVENNHKKYLKNLISSADIPDLRSRMHSLFANRLRGLVCGESGHASKAVLEAFRAAVREAPPVSAEEPWDVRETLRVLREDDAFYRWVFQRDGDVIIYWHCNQYQARVPKSWSCIMVSVFRLAQRFAESLEMIPLSVANGRDGFDESYGMFVGQSCIMRKSFAHVPGVDAEVRFLADYQRSYPVELWISWENSALSANQEKEIQQLGSESAIFSFGSRRGFRIKWWSYSPEVGGEGKITSDELKAEVEKLVNTPPFPPTASIVFSPEGTP